MTERTALPNTHPPAETLCDDAQTTVKPSQTAACVASGYRADCPKRAFEFPMLHTSAFECIAGFEAAYYRALVYRTARMLPPALRFRPIRPRAD